MRATKLRVGLAVAILITILGGTTAYASHDFGDVPDTNGFHNNIDWMKQRQITFGCNTAGTLYCPQANVTRGQMAAFMERLARTLSPRTLGAINPSGTLVSGTTPVVCDTGDYTSENWAETFHVTGTVSVQQNVEPASFSFVYQLVWSEDNGATWIPFTGLTGDTVPSGGPIGIGSAATSGSLVGNDGFGGLPIRFGIQIVQADNTLDAFVVCDLNVAIEHRYSNPIAGVIGGTSDGARTDTPVIEAGSFGQ